MAERFSWVIRDRIAGMERPGLFASFESDMAFLRDKGVNVIVNLEEYERIYPGFEYCHFPIRDFGSPGLDTFNRFADYAGKKIAENGKIVVHCHAGMGRTNLMIACYLVRFNSMRPDQALSEVKESRPVFLVTPEQEESLWEFYYTIS